LEQPGRSWPVTVDPTLVESAVTAGGEINSGGATLCGRPPLSPAFEYPQSSAWVKRSLINLDLSAIPAGAQIKEAAVNLYSPTPAAATSGVELRQLTS